MDDFLSEKTSTQLRMEGYVLVTRSNILSLDIQLGFSGGANIG